MSVRRHAPAIVFVPLWTSGFLVGALGVRHVPAMTLLAWRFVIAAAVLAAIAIATRAPWPCSWRGLGGIVLTGILLQGVQFGAAYLAYSRGVTAALAALVTSAAPLLVAAGASRFLGETLVPRQWAGLLIGLLGVGIAIADGLEATHDALGLAFAVLAVLGLASGTLLQRRLGMTMDLRTGGAIQLAAAASIIVPLAALTSGLGISARFAALGPVLWLSLVSSVAAMSLLYWLLQRGSSSATASLLYLVPPLTALLGVPVLGNPIRLGAVVGFGVSLLGVYFVRAPRRRVEGSETTGPAWRTQPSTTGETR